MVKITDAAVKQFKKILSERGATHPHVRIFVSGGGCCGGSYGIDFTKNGEVGDTIIEKDGLRCYIEPAVHESLSESTLDFRAGNVSISGKRRAFCCG